MKGIDFNLGFKWNKFLLIVGNYYKVEMCFVNSDLGIVRRVNFCEVLECYGFLEEDLF